MPLGHKGFVKNDPAINREGRAPSTQRIKDALEDKPLTLGDLGTKELASLFRKVRPHAKNAMNVMVTLMNRESASDTVRMTASKSVMELYVALVKEAYMSQKDKAISPDAEVANNEPAAVFHLKVVDKLSDADRK